MTLDFSSLERALASLARAVERSIREPDDEEVRDAAIQRFEYSYERATPHDGNPRAVKHGIRGVQSLVEFGAATPAFRAIIERKHEVIQSGRSRRSID